jgi:hypothetical protein
VSEVIDATAEDIGTEVVPVQPAAPPATLFRTDDPAEVLKRARATADALAPVIRAAGLVSQIEGKDYLNVEAWQTLGQQVGVTGVIVSTRRLENGWEARCEARTLDGRTIGAADSMCTRDEKSGRGKERWKDSNDFEIRSMAQTRAMSRALSSVLRFIPTLAGMGGTPAEEMEGVRRSGPSKPSTKQLDFLERLAKDAGFAADELAAVMAYASQNLTGGKGGSCSKVIDKLKDKASATETADKLGAAAKAWAAQQTDVPYEEPEQPPADDEEPAPF